MHRSKRIIEYNLSKNCFVSESYRKNDDGLFALFCFDDGRILFADARSNLQRQTWSFLNSSSDEVRCDVRIPATGHGDDV
jgi:hypothetical protein